MVVVDGSDGGAITSAGRRGGSTAGSTGPAVRAGVSDAGAVDTAAGCMGGGSVAATGFVGRVFAIGFSDSLVVSVATGVVAGLSAVGVPFAVPGGVPGFEVEFEVVAAVEGRFLLGFSSIDTIFPTCFNCTSLRSTMPLQNVTTGPSSRRLCRAANLARRSSSRCFSASSQRFRLLEFLFSTISASFSRSAWVMGGFFKASILLAFFSINSSCLLRLASRSTICWCSCSLLNLVVFRSDARVGMSAAVGSQLARSDFFFGLGFGGGGAVAVGVSGG